MPRFRPTPEQSFFSKIDQSGTCWIWKAASRGALRNYGTIWDGKKLVAAHRFSYEIHFSEIPPGMVVMHKCDVPKCVHPDHLTIGTQLENMRDCVAKGRQARRIINRKKFCRRGHDFSIPENVYYPPNKKKGRMCRVCKRLINKPYLKRWKERKKNEKIHKENCEKEN